jgi:hypothetical protein
MNLVKSQYNTQQYYIDMTLALVRAGVHDAKSYNFQKGNLLCKKRGCAMLHLNF